MKKTILAALIAAGLLSSAAAQAEGTYVSVGVGRSDYSDLDEGRSHKKTAMSLAFGQSLGNNLGYELGYVNFGSIRYADEYFGAETSAKARVQSVYAAAVGTLPISDAFSLFAKAGVSVNRFERTEAALDGVSFYEKISETKTGPMVGLGAAYNFTKEIAATVEYRYFHKVVGNDVKASALTAGIRYSF